MVAGGGEMKVLTGELYLNKTLDNWRLSGEFSGKQQETSGRRMCRKYRVSPNS